MITPVAEQFSLFDDVHESKATATHTIPVRAHMRRVVGEAPLIATKPQVRAPKSSGEGIVPSPPIAPAPHNGTQTSRSAATQITGSGKASVLRERVFAAIADSGERGATRSDLEVICQIDGNTLRPRVWELLGNGGFEARTVEDGEKRHPDCKPGAMRQSVLRVLLT